MKNSEQADPHSATVKIESAGVRTRKCMVHLLNGQEFQCNVQKNADGSQLLKQIRELLDIIEFDYFGLYFEDSAQTMYWLEPGKSIKKQLKNSPWKFHMAVKFYPSDPSQLSEDMARYYMVLQLRDNIVSGRLPCSFVTHALLGSFVVQSELGDYDPASMRGNYVKGFEFAPNQSNELEDKVIELHKTHKGLTPEQAEIAFLENVKKLPLYGVDQHTVKDSENVELILGVSWNGLRVYRDQTAINRFAWPRIVKISYARNKYFIKIRPVEEQLEESIVGFKLPNHKSAKRLWKSSVEHHTFFRLTQPEFAKPKLVRTGSRFRYSGQTQYQTRQTVASSTRKNVPKIQRTPSRRSHRGPSVNNAQTPPELPKKARGASQTQVITTILEVTEETTEVEKNVPEIIPITNGEETVETQNSAKRDSSSSSSSSSSDEESMDALSKHQKRVLKMKPQNENDEEGDRDGKFLEEPPPGNKGASDWDLKLQSSSLQKSEQEEECDSTEKEEPREVMVVTETVVTEIVEEVADKEKSSQDEVPSYTDDRAPADRDEPETRRDSTSSSSDDSSSDESGEVETEVVVHKEETSDVGVVLENAYVAEVSEDPTPETAVTKEPSEDTSDSTSETSSSEPSTEENEVKEEAQAEDRSPVNENNNNNDDDGEDDVVAGSVITTVETKSVRVEDVVIPREENEVRKVALTADEDNNVTVMERKSTSSSSSSSSSSDSSSDESGDEDTPAYQKPPIVKTEVAYIEPTAEEKPAVTMQPPVVETETKTITYESNQSPDGKSLSQDVQLLSSQTITAETMSSVTTTHITKTVTGSVSETRVEKSIVITADSDSDLHQVMADAIKDTQVGNPEVSITKVVVHEEKIVESP